jgi:hypothetical protein
MENIDILIYSAPKTAGNTLKYNLVKSNYKVYYTHNVKFFSSTFPGQNNNISLEEYIKKESISKKLVVIMVYREFVDRIISLFFQSFKYFYELKNDESIYDVPTDVLIDYFNNNVIETYINSDDYNTNIREGFFEIFPEETNAFIDNYNFMKGYSTWEKANIQFVVLNFHNIKNWESNLLEILGNKIVIEKSTNTSEEKFYKSKYIDFKEKYLLPKHLADAIFEKNGYPTLFSYCLTYSEKLLCFKKYKINKTLIGKKGYLFLNHDSNQELRIHTNNLCLVNNSSLKKYDKYKDKMILTVFPNKSLVYKHYLPDGFDIKYRPSFDIYNDYFKENIIDGYKSLENEEDIFYKTDTHMNLKGSYKIYCDFVKKINDIFNIHVETRNIIIEKKTVESLAEINDGIGDLTWKLNLGDQELSDTKDNYYFSNDLKELYLKYTLTENDPLRLLTITDNEIIDITDQHINNIIDWNTVSKHIIYKKNINKPKLKCLIFYDSFLLSTLDLYLEMFEEVYLSKTVFYEIFIEAIQPDYIFEFRIERFLT